MEKVHPWCGQPSDRGRLKNRTEQKWWVSMSVCQCVPGITSLIVIKFFVHVTYGHRSVLLWWWCDILCTFGFMDDFIFANKLNSQEQAKQKGVYLNRFNRGQLDLTLRWILKGAVLDRDWNESDIYDCPAQYKQWSSFCICKSQCCCHLLKELRSVCERIWKLGFANAVLVILFACSFPEVPTWITSIIMTLNDWDESLWHVNDTWMTRWCSIVNFNRIQAYNRVWKWHNVWFVVYSFLSVNGVKFSSINKGHISKKWTQYHALWTRPTTSVNAEDDLLYKWLLGFRKCCGILKVWWNLKTYLPGKSNKIRVISIQK